MFVIRFKDIVRLFFKTIIFLVISILLFKSIKIIKFNNLANHNFLNETMILAKSNNNYSKEKGIKKILSSELAIFSLQSESKTDIETISENEIVEKLPETNFIPVSNILNTSIINENNKIDTYTNLFGKAKIKNESDYELTEEFIKTDYKLTNKKDIIIYHTHTCESYTPTEANNYSHTGNYRTTDLNFSVAKVGDELSNNLTNLGFNVVHDKTYHDYPAYTGSYTRGLTTITNLLSNKNTEFVIDLHRDALGNLSSYAPTIKIGDEIVAQVMFVIGTDGGDLEHPNWKNNLNNAMKIQEKAEEMYPGFFKPIILRNSRYNQHVASGACIIEVGATGNTLEQCIGSMKYLANIIKETFDE